MPLPSPARRAFAAALALAPGLAAAQASAPACFPDAARRQVDLHAPRLQALADQLVRTAAEDAAVSRSSLYLLMRQQVLIERIRRGADTHSDTACAVALDRLQRDHALLARTWADLATGATERGVDPLAAANAQALLGDLQLAQHPLADAIAALPGALR